MPNKDGKGPKDSGPRDGRGEGKRRGTGEGKRRGTGKGGSPKRRKEG